MKSNLTVLAIAFVTFLVIGCGNEPQKPAPGTNSETTEATGNAGKGKSQYLTCATCHGQKAEGMKTLSAPFSSFQFPVSSFHFPVHVSVGSARKAHRDAGAGECVDDKHSKRKRGEKKGSKQTSTQQQSGIRSLGPVRTSIRIPVSRVELPASSFQCFELPVCSPILCVGG